ncbi:MAG: M12 family metallo-peptidase [Phycisphaerae bacterium]
MHLLVVLCIATSSVRAAEGQHFTVVSDDVIRPTFNVQIEGDDYRLHLEPYSLLADDFDILSCDEGNDCQSQPVDFNIPTYRGWVQRETASADANRASGVVAATRIGAVWRIALRLDDESWWRIEPADGAVVATANTAALNAAAEVAYEVSSFAIDDGVAAQCGCQHVASPVAVEAPTRNFSFGSSNIETVIEVAVDTDFEYIQNLNFSASAAVEDVQAVFNAVSLIYEQEFGVRYELSALILRPASPFPYTSSNHQTLLAQMKSEWNTNLAGVHRDIAHLLTGKEIDSNIIGFAYTGTMCEVCNNAEGYGFSETGFSTLMSRRACLTAHELGHNWGASHCDGSSDCGIMCSVIGGCSGSCTTFGTFPGAVIEQAVLSATCSSSYVEPINFPFCDTFSATIDPLAWTFRSGATTTQGISGTPSGTYVLQLDNCCTACANAPDEVRSNRIRMAGIPSATISFFVREGGAAAMAGSSLVVEVGGGVDWTEVERLTATGSVPDEFTRYAVDVPQESLTDDFQFRFRIEPVSGSDVWYLDNVLVSGQAEAASRLHVASDGLAWNDGGSWSSPLSNPGDAINLGACAMAQEIWVAEGTYSPDGGTGNRGMSFTLGDDVVLIGGFAGDECSLDQRDPVAYPTVLSGEIGNPGSILDNSYHVVTVTGNAGTTLLSGFTIRDGYANESPTDGGGGLTALPGSCTVDACRFEHNTGYTGGAMRLALGSLFDVRDTVFASNQALDKGGAVHVSLGCQPMFDRCIFFDNNANSWGGGAYFSDSLVSVTNSLVYNNQGQNGGGLYNHFATLTLEGSTLTQNHATSAVGGLFNNNGAAMVDNTILWANTDTIFTGQSSQISGGSPTVNYTCIQDLSGSLGGLGNVDADPMFIDPDGEDLMPGTGDEDFRLAFNSTLRNLGSPVADPLSQDLAGHPRVLCGVADMGAYEFGLGDSDCDGQFLTLDDFSQWSQCRTEPGVAAAINCRVVDLNVDGSVDLRDYAIWQLKFGE